MVEEYHLESWVEVAEKLSQGYTTLTLSTAEAGRFLHTVPSTLWSTCVSAFTPSWF
jgi:hypothetical protein